MRHKDVNVVNLMNIGPATARWLDDIGIQTQADLEKMGAVEAYNLIKAKGHNASLNLLYALHGALEGTSWNRLSPETKASLQSSAAGFRFISQETAGDLGIRCVAEVVELHQFFQDWFNGVLADNDEEYGRFTEVMAADFRHISPDGRTRQRRPLLAGLRQIHGQWGDGRIWIEHPCFRAISSCVGLVTYEEWQEHAGQTTRRLSTAIFRDKPCLPNNVEWVHVHETWLEP